MFEYQYRWIPLSLKECRSILTSRGLWILVAVLPMLLYNPSYAPGIALGADSTVGYLQYAGTLILPLVVILFGYRAVVGEVESGSIKLTLALPLARSEFLLAKLVGRTVGIALPILFAMGIVVLIGVSRHGMFSPIRFIAVLGVTVFYIAVLVFIVVSVSTIADRAIQSAGYLFIGLFVILELFWQDAVAPAILDVADSLGVVTSQSSGDALLLLILRLSPSGAYNVVTNWILGVGNSAHLHAMVIRERNLATETPALVAEEVFSPGSVPYYLHESGGLLVLLLWAVVSLAIALLYLRRGDVL